MNSFWVRDKGVSPLRGTILGVPHGWLSIFFLPGTANAAKIMVLPYDEQESEGLE